MLSRWGDDPNVLDPASIMEWELGGTVMNDLLNENSPWGLNVLRNRIADSMHEEDISDTYLDKYVIGTDDCLYYVHNTTEDNHLYCELIMGKEVVKKENRYWYITTDMVDHWFESYAYAAKKKGGNNK